MRIPFHATIKDFKVFDTSDGLPDNTVKCITQDTLGFIWMGTFNGLCRFDGINFVTYKHNPEDEHSIANNHIEAILATGADLWIGTESGLNRYSFEEDRFYPCYVQSADGEKPLNSPIRSWLVRKRSASPTHWHRARRHIPKKSNASC